MSSCEIQLIRAVRWISVQFRCSACLIDLIDTLISYHFVFSTKFNVLADKDRQGISSTILLTDNVHAHDLEK